MAWRRTIPAAKDPPPGWDPGAIVALVAEVEAKYLPADASRQQKEQFRERLHLDDLLLARACARGDDAAWNEFCRKYQPGLRASARAMTHDAVRGEELADGLLGDLFGLRTRGGERYSKLSAYMGLGSLEGWLRALLAQAHVDEWRQRRRWTGLDESEPLQTLVTFPHPAPATFELSAEEGSAASGLRQKLEAAIESVLRSLDSAGRLLLNLYFLDGQTLAQIAILLGVHESTISRRLERQIASLRKQVRRELARQGLRPDATEAAMQLKPEWLNVDVRKNLAALGNPQHGA